MKKSASRKVNTGSALRTVLMVLLVLELCAAVLLSTRLVSSGEKRRLISLTEGSKGSVVTVTEKELRASTGGYYAGSLGLAAAGGYYAAPLSRRASAAPLSRGGTDTAETRGDFRVADADKVWETETDVELFRLHYDNDGDLVYTVESSNGDKLLAPGTENAYEFTLANTGRMPLDYTLTFECWMEGGDGVLLPIQARLLNGDGNYLLGSETGWRAVRALNSAGDSRTLRSGEGMNYIFEWRWPFERGQGSSLNTFDTQDTALGNAAVEEDLSLHIRILTVAEIDEELVMEMIDDDPIALAAYNGAAWALVNLICTVLSGILGIYELVVFLRGRKEDEEAEDNGVYDEDVYQRLRKRRKRKIWDLVPAVGAIIAFILTEDIRLPMVWLDRWSPLMIIILAISVTVALLTRLKKLRDEIDEMLKEAVEV